MTVIEYEGYGEVPRVLFGPSIAKPVMIAFVDNALAELGTELFAEVRKKRLPVAVCKLPFVANNYFRG